MKYSKKALHKIEAPQNGGFFTSEDAQQRGMRLAIGQEGDVAQGKCVALYLLVDEEDGVIADAKFQVFGDPAMIAAADSVCELLLRKNYDQARRISAELIDKHVRDKKEEEAFPPQAATAINYVLSAIDIAAMQCMDIPIAEVYVSSPISSDETSSQQVEGWEKMGVAQQIQLIEEVIASDIRPYIELDEGGVRVLNIIEGKEVVIAYEGSCTSCYSATGSTLHAIQQILRTKVHSDLVVTPDTSFLR